MTIASHGYDGTLDERDFSELMAYLGRPPIVGGKDDLRVTAVPGSRAVEIHVGGSYAVGVQVDVTDEDGPTRLTLPTPTNGQFLLIALRRDWQQNNSDPDAGELVEGSSFQAISADTTPAVVPLSTPAVLPPIAGTPGVQFDQALAWVWVSSATTDVVAWDLRTWAADWERVATIAARDAIPAQRLYVGKRVQVDANGQVYRRAATTWNLEGVNPCTSETRPSEPFLNMLIFETDSKQFGFWNGSGYVFPGRDAGNLSGNMSEDVRATTVEKGDDSTRIATTKFVRREFATLESPVLTGAPEAATPGMGDSSRRIVTTSWSQYNSGIRVNSLQELYDLQGSNKRPPVGSIIHWGPSSDYFAHYGSLWRVRADGRFSPVNGVPILLRDMGSLGNLEYNYKGGWDARLAFDHRSTAVVCDSPFSSQVQWEHRWDEHEMRRFRLWPGADTYSRLEYDGYTDQYLDPSTTTIYRLWNRWDWEGLNLGQNNGYISLPHRGRYEFTFALAITNDDPAERFAVTVYNSTRGRDEFVGFSGAYGDRPMQGTVQHHCFENDQVCVAIYRTSNGGQWFRRGAADQGFYGYRPRMFIKYLGWR